MQSALLTCSQASVILGLSSSSVKRLCDGGQLEAIRTAGGHRRISRESVQAWKQRAATEAGIELHEETSALDAGQTIRSLLDGDLDLVFGSWDRLRQRRGVTPFIDEVIGPMMAEVGKRWQASELAVHEEHRISEQVRYFLSLLSEQTPRHESTGRRAIGSAPGHELADIASKAIELSLRESGWHAVSCGANLPANELAEAAIAFRAELVWVSYTHDQPPGQARSANRLLRDSLPSSVRLVVGGSSLNTELRKQLVFDFAGDTLAHLESFVSRI